jgi:hypothetical protein
MTDDKPTTYETLDHMDTLRRVVDLINSTEGFLDAEADTPEDEAAVDQPALIITGILADRSKTIEVIMVLVTMIHDTGDQEKVQGWVNAQLGGALMSLAEDAS